MKKRLVILISSIGIILVLCFGLHLMLSVSEIMVSIPLVSAQEECCEITTSNETIPPGDWPYTYSYNTAACTVVRTTDEVYSGTYSYQYHANATDSYAWMWTYITCTDAFTEGFASGWFMLTDEWGHTLHFPVMKTGHVTNPELFGWDDALTLYYDDFEKRYRLECKHCDPVRDWGLGLMIPDTWQHLQVLWSLPVGASTGTLRAWQGDQTIGDILYVDESGITVEASDAPGHWDATAFGTGIGEWHYWYDALSDLYVDEVEFTTCYEPPAPEPGDCQQYGHAAVLNVDNDCEAVLRFRTLPSYIPGGAVVTRATLRIYGVASEVLGETIYVTPLNALWGEMTTDWCRRLVGTDWAEAGAYDIPLDREPGTIANFETALGWIDIELPLGLVEEWALTGEANPGLILHNANLTGKFSAASREWHVEDYAPHIDVWYTN